MAFNQIKQRNIKNAATLEKVFLDTDEKIKGDGDIEYARRHAEANRIAYEDLSIPPFYCTCCMKNVNRKLFDLNCDIDELGQFGIGYPLYFKVIEKLNWLMFTVALFHGIPSLVLNLLGNSCKNYSQEIALALNLCISNIFNSPTLANRFSEERKLPIQMWIDAIAFYIILLCIFYLRLKLFQETVQLKGKVGHDINDFSVYMYNLPRMGTRRLTNLLRKYFRRLNYNNGYTYEIKHVCQLYDTREYLILKERSSSLQEEINKLLDEEGLVLYSSSISSASNSVDEVHKSDNIHRQRKLKEQDLKDTQEKIRMIEMMIAQSSDNSNLIYLRKSFITFKMYGASNDILQRYSEEFFTTLLWRRVWNLLRGGQGEGKNRLYFEGNEVRIVPAVHPHNLMWENLAIPTVEKYTRRSLIVLIGFLLSCICMIFVSMVAKFQIFKRHDMLMTMLDEGTHSTNYIVIRGTIVVVSLVILVINQITIYLLSNSVRFEMHEKRTRHDSSIAEKLTYQYFFISAFVVLCVNWYFDNVWIYGGLVSQVAVMFFTNFLVKIITPVFDAFYFFRLFKQFYWLAKKYKINQNKLNLLFEYRQFDFATQSAGCISQVNYALFFANLIPFGSLITLLTQIPMYKMHKWSMLRRCTASKKFGDDLSLQIVNLIDLSLVFYALGTMMNYRMIVGSIPTVYYVHFGLAILYCMLPLNHITRKMVKIPRAQRFKKYGHYRAKFDRERYELLNPVRDNQYIEMSEGSV